MTSLEGAGRDATGPAPTGPDRDEPEGQPPRRRKVVPWRGRPLTDAERAAQIEGAEVAAVREADQADLDRSMRERGRKIGGAPGAAMAGLMIALRDIYESPKRDDGAVVVDSPSEPHDAHRDGMQFDADEVGADSDVEIVALERKDPVTAPRRRGAWRRGARH